MLRVLFIILAVVSIALAMVLGQPLLYLLAFILLVGAALLLTMNMRRKHRDVPETFMQAPEQPEEDLSSFGILDIKPRSASQVFSDEANATKASDSGLDLDVHELEDSVEQLSSDSADKEDTPLPSSSSMSPVDRARTAGVSKARTRAPRPRIMVSEADSAVLADVLIPCLRSLRASVDAYTVCLLRQEDVPLRYQVEVMVSQNSYARNGGSYSAKEPMLSGHKALVPVVYPRVGPNGFPKNKLGYYHESIDVRQVAIVPILPKKHDSLFLMVVDTMNDDGLESASVRVLLEQYARLVSTILDTTDERIPDAAEDIEALRPRREIIADEMEHARTMALPLSLALVYLNRGEALSGDGSADVEGLEDSFSNRLRSVALDARVERFGELTYGVFYHGDHDQLAEWASRIKESFPDQDEPFEGGVSVGVVAMKDRHDGADELRAEATAALAESFQSGECIIVE
ncbi:MAG: hypothetical protein O3A57_02110 [Bacteroidetes bacterium]|nr:hypothetical protein [Bacteroidota bacterium]